jgi:hypothetical protein
MVRTIFCSALMILCSLQNTEARIGETEKQCIARYGEPVKYMEKGVLFIKDSMKIYVTFAKGRADSIWLQKLDAAQPGRALQISKEEIEKYLKANCSGYTWQYSTALPDGDVVWITKDSELGALYSLSTCSLQVYTRDCIAK